MVSYVNELPEFDPVFGDGLVIDLVRELVVDSGSMGRSVDRLVGIEDAFGSAGNDTIRGDGRDNLIVEGQGGDLLRGGGGADLFSYTDVSDSQAGGFFSRPDRITDFEARVDRIGLAGTLTPPSGRSWRGEARFGPADGPGTIAYHHEATAPSSRSRPTGTASPSYGS